MIKKIKKFANSVINLSNYYSWNELYKYSNNNFDENLNVLNVLVLAPHPDDDVLGLGGLLNQLSKKKAKIKVIFIFNGERGTKDGKVDKKLITLRQEEAKKALSKINPTIEFVNLSDGEYSQINRYENLLKKEIIDNKPETIFTPWLVDEHPDHQIVTRKLVEVLKDSKNTGINIWQYEIWSPLFPNKYVDIDKELMAKKEAIMAHKSQLICRDYQDGIIGLNQFRAMQGNTGKVAEAFFVQSKEHFIKLAEKICK